MKKIAVLGLTCLLVLSLILSACGGSQPQQATTAAPAATTAAATTAAATTAAAAEATTTAAAVTTTTITTAAPVTTTQAASESDEVPFMNPAGVFPIVNEKITLSAFARQLGYVADYIDNDFTRWYEEYTNIALDWIISPDTEVTTRLNLILASGDYPDIIIDPWVITPTQLVIYGQQGVFIPLNDLIKEYGIEVTTALNLMPEWWGLITQPDGNIYGLPHIDDCFHCKYPNKMWVYEPWLEALNMPMPVTTDDFYNMLVAFRDMDPNGNGQNDEIPFAGVTVGTGRPSLMIYMMNAFIYTDPSYFRVDNDVVDPVFNKPEWQEGLKYLNGLYNDKLLAPESFTQDQNMLKQLNGGDDIRVGVFPELCPWNGLPSDIKDERWINYKGIPPLQGPTGIRAARSGLYDVGNMTTFVISSACKYPEAAFRWADALYTTENTLRKYYGPPDEVWRWPQPGEIGINGLPAVWTSISKDGGEFDQPNYGSIAHIAPHYRSDAFRLGQSITGDPNYNAEAVLFRETKENYEPFAVHINTIMPPLVYTEEQSNDLIDIQVTMNNFIHEMFARFITGDLDINSQWDTYISQLNAMGLDRYVEIQQAAYDAKWKGR